MIRTHHEDALDFLHRRVLSLEPPYVQAKAIMLADQRRDRDDVCEDLEPLTQSNAVETGE